MVILKTKKLIYVSLFFGMIIGSGATKFLYSNGLTSGLDFKEFIKGLSSDRNVERIYNFKERSKLSDSKEWAIIVNNRKFQILSNESKSDIRDSYFNNSIKPTLPPYGVDNAKDEFYRYANEVESEVKKHGFFEKVLPLPRSKTLRRFSNQNYIAPLEIRTRDDGYNYYVKISTWNSNLPILTLFIRTGEKVKTKLPLGSYVVKYASGKKWHGQKHMFGPDTSYSKAQKKFTFNKSVGRISGYTIELFTQLNGNLPTSTIQKSDW
jgi:hypothetical protein